MSSKKLGQTSFKPERGYESTASQRLVFRIVQVVYQYALKAYNTAFATTCTSNGVVSDVQRVLSFP